VPLIDSKYDWYQNATHVFISYKVANANVSEKAEVSFGENSVSLKYSTDDNNLEINLNLSNSILPEESSKSISAKKIELKLRKAIDNVTWLKIEKDG
jgi:hypothetical protein